MKTITEKINDAISSIPQGKGEMVIQTKEGEIIPLEVGVKFPEGSTIIQRSPEESIKRIIKDIFGTDNITATIYISYIEDMKKLNELIVNQLSNSTKTYLKTKTDMNFKLDFVPIMNKRRKAV